MITGVIEVCGLGPGPTSLLDRTLVESINAADVIFVRTVNHPSAPEFIELCNEAGKEAESFDFLYEEAEEFEELYHSISDRLVQEASKGSRVLYVVPGSPSVGESTVKMLLAQQDARVILRPALSFLDLAWTELRMDPIDGISIVDCYEFLAAPGAYGSNVLIMQCYSQTLVDDLLNVAEELECEVIILHHLGLEDQEVIEVEEYSWPVSAQPDHLTSVMLKGIKSPVREILALWETVKTLRVRCPWDAEQTHTSLTRHVIEEAYEVVEAIDELSVGGSDLDGAMEHLREELGDLLLQVFFHANLAREAGWFSVEDVAETIDTKLRYRHPHVFGDVTVGSASEVVSNWEKLKKVEKDRSSVLEGVSASLPSTIEVQKIYRKYKGLNGDLESLQRLTPSGDSSTEPNDKFYLDVIAALDNKVDIDAILRSASRTLRSEILKIEDTSKES